MKISTQLLLIFDGLPEYSSIVVLEFSNHRFSLRPSKLRFSLAIPEPISFKYILASKLCHFFKANIRHNLGPCKFGVISFSVIITFLDVLVIGRIASYVDVEMLPVNASTSTSKYFFGIVLN